MISDSTIETVDLKPQVTNMADMKVAIPSPTVFTPEFINDPNNTAEMIAQELLNAPYVDVTEGFPARDPQQLLDILLHLMRKGVSRIPFVGTGDPDDPASIRVYMLTNSKYQPPMHNNLMDEMGSPVDAIFSTAIEGLDDDSPPTSSAALELNIDGKVSYITFKPGSETTDIRIGFGNGGKDALQKVFAIPGVKLIK